MPDFPYHVDHLVAAGMTPAAARMAELNWLALGSAVQTGLPFFVVAADGTGNYTSIKAAIDALPTSTIANDISGVIYVKWSPTAYNDGASTIDISNKQVVLIGESPVGILGRPVTDSGLFTMPGWTSSFITATATGRLYAYGIDFQQTTLTNASQVSFNLERCRINNLSSAATLSLSNFTRCRFTSAPLTAVAATMTNVMFDQCDLQSGWNSGASSATQYSGIVLFNECIIFGQGTCSWKGSNGSTGGDEIRFDDCEFNVNATVTWTFNLFSTEDHISITGCKRNSSQTGVLTLAFSGSGHGPSYALLANELPYTDLSFTGSPTDAAITVTGTYRRVTSSQTLNLTGTLTCRGGSTITALTLNSGCVGSVIDVTVIPGTSITGYAIAAGANNNLITIGNLAALTTAGTNSGTNNIINGTVGGSGVQLQSNWSQQFLLSGM